MIDRYLLPRPLHPFAWWGYALALALAASLTLNPLFLLAILIVVTFVVVMRRGDNPWAKGFKYYWWLGLFIIAFRIFFRIIFGGGDGPTVLFNLPEIPLPSFVVGIRLLGPVSLESLLTGFYDGLRLATIIVCIGAANSLANPKRLLAALPASLYELGTVLVVAVSVFPQLGESIKRVARVRKLRRTQTPKTRRQRLGIIESIIVPVLSDALDRSMALAASMEARGYGRSGKATSGERTMATTLGLVGVGLLGIWAYFLLASPPLGTLWEGDFLGFSNKIPTADVVEWCLLAGGVFVVVKAMRVIGRQAERSRYRPDHWQLAETVTVVSGLLLVLVTVWTENVDRETLFPMILPFTVPTLTPALLLGLLIAAMPAVATPAPTLITAQVPEEVLS